MLCLKTTQFLIDKNDSCITVNCFYVKMLFVKIIVTHKNKDTDHFGFQEKLFLHFNWF